MQALDQELELFEINAKQKISIGALRRLLPNIETTLFFAKVYKLDYYQLSDLLRILWDTPLVQALTDGAHSLDLQDYIVDTFPPDVVDQVHWEDEAPPVPVVGELLPHLWEEALVTVADSIQQVADRLVGTLNRLPSKEGQMVFRTLNQMNRNRPTVGTYRAQIHHQQVPDVAVVLDVSGSMTRGTVETIIKDVVALAWKANAHMFIVSNNSYHWEPGDFTVESVLAKAEFGGTQYETLASAFNKDWGSVITIADYDSSMSAKQHLRRVCKGSIGTVYDISLVNRPTFLGECLGQFAKEVKPLLVARRSLTSWY